MYTGSSFEEDQQERFIRIEALMSLVEKYLQCKKQLNEAVYGTDTALDDAAISDMMEHLWEQMSDDEHQEITLVREAGKHI